MPRNRAWSPLEGLLGGGWVGVWGGTPGMSQIALMPVMRCDSADGERPKGDRAYRGQGRAGAGLQPLCTDAHTRARRLGLALRRRRQLLAHLELHRERAHLLVRESKVAMPDQRGWAQGVEPGFDNRHRPGV